MLAVDRLRPNWRNLVIHETSPTFDRGCSIPLKAECQNYVPTHFWPNVRLGSLHNGIRCEDVERQTFPSDCFDIVVAQDVYEHIFHPSAATKEIYRTLRRGGVAVITTGVWKDKLTTETWASLNSDGTIKYLITPPEYHGNPISGEGSLVTFKYGYDFPDQLARWAPFSVELWRFNDRYHGIVGEFTDVVVLLKN